MTRAARKKINNDNQEKPSPSSAASLAHECERLEQLCHALEERAEAAEQAHRLTATTVAHDLCNALSVIVMSSRLLARTVGQDSAGRKQIDAILRAADEMELLARDLVDASHIEAGSLRVDSDPQEVEPLVARALELAAPAAAAKPVTLGSQVAPMVGSVEADHDRLVQVLLTMITNAVRFTPRGGQITVGAEPAGPAGVRFWIADNGPGIPAEQQVRLFARFAQSRRPPCQAIGLGPFVAKGIIEAHGGEISVESQPGAGTTVSFTVPAAEPRAAALEAAVV
ncbi:MAG TPA: HAMP domain-containing sensor histidine kinase [Candidatus Nanopelagicales bacterium]|nr:HAMP domain-containing sensor histidine kinase [Candidatus Nanopelagicales bacterium]